MYSKAQIYNLALGALLLTRQISDTDTDLSNECKVLNIHFDTAFRATLEDLDCDSTSTQAPLALIATCPVKDWKYAYLYPVDCAFLRRIQSCYRTDNRYSHIPKLTRILNNQKVILTNQCDAIVEYISVNVPLPTLSANIAMAIAYKLALLSAPLIAGKGSVQLRAQIQQLYISTKAEAQAMDRNENFNFTDPAVDSEFVAVRTT